MFIENWRLQNIIAGFLYRIFRLSAFFCCKLLYLSFKMKLFQKQKLNTLNV